MSAIETFSVADCGPGCSRPARKNSILETVFKWMRNARSRQHLSQLTEAQLEDIGLTQDQVRVELKKPFWAGPQFR